MEATASMPIDPYAGARRAYLRPFVLRAAWAAILAGALGLFLLLLLFLVMEPVDEVLNAVNDRRTLWGGLIVFWAGAGASLVGVLLCGIVAATRSPELFGFNPLNGAKSVLSSMKSARIYGGIALFIFVGALGVPLVVPERGSANYYEIVPNSTPPETVQTILFVIAGSIAFMLLVSRRAMSEVRWALMGEEVSKRAAFEVLMPQAGAAFSNQPIAAPMAGNAPAFNVPAVSAPVGNSPATGSPAATAAPPMAPSMPVSWPPARSPITMHGLSGDPAGGRLWDGLFAAVLLMTIGLSITHLWLLYAFRSELKNTRTMERIYTEYSEVPQDPRTTTPNPYGSSGPRNYRYRTSNYGYGAPQVPKKTEPLAGMSAVAVVGGSVGLVVFQAGAVLWAMLCLITGAKMRVFGLIVAWTMVFLIVVATLSHVHLIQQFKFAPQEVAAISFVRGAGNGEFRDIQRLSSPIDVGLKQIIVPLAMILVLSGERVRRMLRGSGN